jgi:hypothetical protein
LPFLCNDELFGGFNRGGIFIAYLRTLRFAHPLSIPTGLDRRALALTVNSHNKAAPTRGLTQR